MIWDAFPVDSASNLRGAHQSTASLISCDISLNDAGEGSPEMLAEVDTSGARSLRTSSRQNS